MQAYVWTGYGDLASHVTRIDAPRPIPKHRELVIELHAAGLNPIDYKLVRGVLRRIRKYTLPHALGFDGSGVVVNVGASVTRFKPGDEVFLRAAPEVLGTFAEFVVASEGVVAPKPTRLGHLEAASIPLVGLTTAQAFVGFAGAHAGQHVLIQAGSGGVGTFAIQYAKALGLEVTTTVSSGSRKMVEELGADHVICYDKESYLDRATTGGIEYDIVYDLLGGEHTLQAFEVVRRGGVVVSIAGPPDREFARRERLGLLTRVAIFLMNRKVYARARAKNASYYRFLTRSDGGQLAEIGEMIDAGLIRPVIDRVFPFAQGLEALEYLARGRSKGKVVLQVKDST